MSNDQGMTKSESRSIRLASSFNHSSLFRHSSFELRHFLRKTRPQFRADNERQPDRDQEKGKKLSARETGDETRVRFAKILDHDPEDRVNDKKQSGEHAVRLAHSCADEPQNQKQDDPFEKSLVELRRMARSQNSAKNFFHLRLVTHGRDNCLRRNQRRVDLGRSRDR